SRGDDGQITFREWHPVGAEEYGYIAPDPLDPDVVYGGKLSRYDRRTGQTQTIAPRPVPPAEGVRVLRTEPVLFAPTDPHTLYFASNVVWKTTDGGRTWTAVSPDLTRKTWEPPPNVGKYRGTDAAKPTQRGVVYTVAPSPLDGRRTWTHVTAGLPDGGIVNAVREDPVRRGLLFAGTEQAVHVSFDDGESWQPLRLNMPATSIRDLVVKDDDLVVGTHGRSFWILDDITPLRQLTPALVQEAAVLLRPQDAWRFRWSKYTDTPLPPDEPAGPNPPDGATVDSCLQVHAPTPV